MIVAVRIEIDHSITGTLDDIESAKSTKVAFSFNKLCASDLAQVEDAMHDMTALLERLLTKASA